MVRKILCFVASNVRRKRPGTCFKAVRVGGAMADAGVEGTSRYWCPHFCDLEAAELWKGLVLLEDGSAAAEGFVRLNSCSRMLLAIIIVAIVRGVVYFLRRNFRRAWYVLRTGDEHADWEKLGGDYF